MNNPMQIMQALMQRGIKNPQQIIMNLAGENNPMINNLVEMANKGDSKGIENFARNMFKEKGRDFDKEFSEFRSKFK